MADSTECCEELGIYTETLADFGPAAMMANANDLIRSPPIPA
jgi:hypothetical protein